MTRSQTILDISGGVSRLPQVHRSSNQWEDLLNTLLYDGRVQGRRPPTFHVAHLSESADASQVSFPIIRSATERYEVVIADGVLQVFDGYTGDPVDVIAPDGFSYLFGALDGYRWTTVGDQTILVNRSVTLRKGSSTDPLGDQPTLVVVRQGNFGTRYQILVDSDGSVDSADTVTPTSTAAGAEEAISTDAIAEALFDVLSAVLSPALYTVERYGSTIAIYPVNPTLPYKVSTADGLGDEGMAVIVGSVQRIEDLPPQAPDGTVLEVRGSEQSSYDNLWVRYSASSSTWDEILQPGLPKNVDASTFPHLLEYQGPLVASTPHDGAESADTFTNGDLALVPNAYFGMRCRNLTDGSEGIILSNTATDIVVAALAGGANNVFRPGDEIEVRSYAPCFVFRPVPWSDRAAGTDTTNPFPSLIGSTVQDVAVVQSRLLLLGEKSFRLSKAGDLFNLFRTRTILVEPDGPIDLTTALPTSTKFHSVVPWDRQTYLWSDLVQYELVGEPILSPQTVALVERTAYPNLRTVRPVFSGSRIFFMGLVNRLPKVMEYLREPQGDAVGAQSLSDGLLAYFEGEPAALIADDTAGLLLLHTRDDGTSRLYPMSYTLQDGRIVRRSWGQWVLNDPQPDYEVDLP